MGELTGLKAPVTGGASVIGLAVATAAVESPGGLDILVNADGIGARGTVQDASGDEWHRVLDVKVNAVHPGTADTPWIGRLLDTAPDPAAEQAALAARQPHGRLVSAGEVAHAALYLVSPRAGSTTGAEIAVDGGMVGLRLRPRT